MRQTTFLLLFLLGSVAAIGQTKKGEKGQLNPHFPLYSAELSCGQCNFGMKGKSCDLAVRFANKTHFIDGINIDSLGDAHAADGFCSVVRKAKVQGFLVKDRYQLTYVKLEPLSKSGTTARRK
jgi:hypothetical protein